MVQMWLLWWPKATATTSTTSTTSTNTTSAVVTATSASQKDSNYCCMSKKTLSKLVRKLKKHGAKMLHHSNLASSSSRTRTRPSSSSFQCRYDPLSYSLNFDTTGSGTLLDDEDYYYKFYAFSSRFVATSNSKPSSSPISQA